MSKWIWRAVNGRLSNKGFFDTWALHKSVQKLNPLMKYGKRHA